MRVLNCTDQCGLSVRADDVENAGQPAVEIVAKSNGWRRVTDGWWCGTCGFYVVEKGRRGRGGSGKIILKRQETK